MEVLEKNKVLDIRIDNLSRKEILKKIKDFLDEPRFHQIATINPEFILEAQKNQRFKNILNSSALNVADGFGIRLAFLRQGKWLKARMAGADLMMEILQLANERGLGIFLVCRADGLSAFEETRDAISKIYPNIKINGKIIECHPRASGDPVTDLNVSTLDSRLRGNDNTGMILFCNFGAPHQEFFINRVKCDRIRLAMGVGGSFDFLTGKIQRAPKIMRQLGMEWFWRIFQQKEFRLKRIKRVLKSIIIFPIKIIFNR